MSKLSRPVYNSSNDFNSSDELVTAFFSAIALSFGLVFALLIPPFQSPDEPGHLFRAYQVSEGVFFPETQDRRLGGMLPASLVQVNDSFSFLKMNYGARIDKSLILNSLNVPLNAEQRAFADFPNTAIYAPTAYLPQATAIALIRPFGATPLQMLYAARISNLLVWLMLVTAALRLMPFLKQTIAALALLPASLVIAASANADVVTNGLCWWLVAALCAQAFPPSGKAGKRREMPVFLKEVAVFAVVCANKLIALPLAMAYWWRTQKRLLPFGILLAAGLAAALTWGSLAQKRFIPYDAYNPAFRDAQTLNEGVDPAGQQAFILENPLFFAKTAITSIAGALPSTAAHFVGKFGWEKNYLPPVWLVLLWTALAALLTIEQNSLSGWQRAAAIGIVVLYAGLFSVTIYALWCPVGAGEVTNFQGRYFVPVAPLAALALAGSWLSRFRGWLRLIAFIILTTSNIAMIWEIMKRYYL